MIDTAASALTISMFTVSCACNPAAASNSPHPLNLSCSWVQTSHPIYVVLGSSVREGQCTLSLSTVYVLVRLCASNTIAVASDWAIGSRVGLSPRHGGLEKKYHCGEGRLAG